MSESLLHIVNVERSDQELQIVEDLRQQSGVLICLCSRSMGARQQYFHSHVTTEHIRNCTRIPARQLSASSRNSEQLSLMLGKSLRKRKCPKLKKKVSGLVFKIAGQDRQSTQVREHEARAYETSCRSLALTYRAYRAWALGLT